MTLVKVLAVGLILVMMGGGIWMALGKTRARECVDSCAEQGFALLSAQDTYCVCDTSTAVMKP